jgi:Hom_end-associated Hint/Homing endonuclease
MPQPVKLIVASDSGGGKCLAAGTPVLLYNGNVLPVERIEQGMQLMGPDNKPRSVLALLRGTGNLIKVVPVKGDSWTCNDEHILTLRHSKAPFEVRDISIPWYRNKMPANKVMWKLFSVGVDWDEQPVFDPYTMGLWLGDGRFDRPEIHSPDKEIHDYLEHFNFGSLRAKTFHPYQRCAYVAITGTSGEENWFTNLIKQFTLTGEKRIPQKYLINSRENRLQLLAGLMDTDGHLHHGFFEIVTQYGGLSNDILFLARSLGFCATHRFKHVEYQGEWRYYHRINISGECSDIPTKIRHKQAAKRTIRKLATVTGFTMQAAGVGEYFGFELDGDGRFLLGNFVVTHNTGALASLAAAGYSLCVADLDNNSSILRNLLTKPDSPYVKANPDVGKMLTSVVSLSEPRGLVGGKFGIKQAQVWSRLGDLLQNWEHDGVSLGSITTWSERDVLVIDTFTRAAWAAMNFHLQMNGRLNQKPSLYDFGDAQQYLRSLLEILTAEEVKCNVVLNCHIDYGETKSGVPTEFPMSIGNALGPQIATYFGSLLQIAKVKKLVNGKQELSHVIRTVPATPLGVKTSMPFGTAAEYGIADGLAQYFKAVRGD